MDMTRSEVVTPNMTPNQSRRASVMIAPNDDGRGLLTPPNPADRRATKEEELREEKEKAVSRVAYVKKLGTLSSCTRQLTVLVG
jgi:hypothetical protein